MRHRTVFVVLVLMLLICAPSPSTARPATGSLTAQQLATEQELRELVGRYGEALRTSNAAGLVVDVTEDAVEMPPNAPALVGRNVIEEAYSELFTLASYEEFQLEVEEIIPMGDWAFVRAKYALVLMSTVEITSPFEDAGKFVLLAEQQGDGSWQAARIMYNSDFPG